MGGVPLFLSSPPVYFFTVFNENNTKKLKGVEKEVKQHELKHFFIGRGYVGLPTFVYLFGTDGKWYPVEGEVSVDLSEEKDPLKTIEKMKRILLAALAPEDASIQDAIVAGIAASKLAKAEEELIKEKLQKTYAYFSK
jgi:hypothetical protein